MAIRSLPDALHDRGFTGRPAVTVDFFRQAAGMAATDDRWSVSSLCRALRFVVGRFEQAMTEPGWAAELPVLATAVEDLRRTGDELGGGSFSVRLRRRAGSGVGDEHEQVEEEGGRKASPHQVESAALAAEACASPSLLTDSLWAWLRSPDARMRGNFLEPLGRLDVGHGRFDTRVAVESLTADGRAAFLAYARGRWLAAPSEFQHWLDTLEANPAIPGEAVAQATATSPGGASACRRLARLVRSGRANPERVGRWANSWFLSGVDAADAADLLTVLTADAAPRYAMAARLLAEWLDGPKPLAGPLVSWTWWAVGGDGRGGCDDFKAFDRVAAWLVDVDLDRAFALFGRPRMGRGVGVETWDPLDGQGGDRQFFDALCRVGRGRAVRCALEATAARGLYGRPRDLVYLLDFALDADELLAFANGGDEAARLVIQVAPPGLRLFWRIALQAVAARPDDARLRWSVEHALRRSTFESGPSGGLAEVVAQVRADPTTPAQLRRWLQELQERVVDDRRWRWASPSPDFGFRHGHHIPDDEFSTERLAALRYLLASSRMASLRPFVRKSELVRLLARLDLAEDARKDSLDAYDDA